MARHDEFNDELLSAYLDGELSADERAAVEARLQLDPAAAELVTQLQAAAQAVRDLPHVAAPQGLKDEILRAATAQMRKAAAPGEAGNGEASPAPVGGVPSWTVGRSRRGWIWGALTVAAALLIMVLSGDGDRERHLARPADNTAQLGDTRGSGGERRDGEIVSANPRDLARAAPRGEGRETESSGRDLREEAAPSFDALAGVGAINVPGAAGEMPSPNVEFDMDLAGSGVGEDGPATNDRLYFRKQNGRGEPEVIVDNADAAFGDQTAEINGEAPVYFVSVNITPQAARNKTITQFFGRNSISFVETTRLSTTQASSPAALGLARGGNAAMDDMQESQALGGAAPAGAEPQSARADELWAAVPQAPGVQTEAEPETLQQFEGELRTAQAEPSQAAPAVAPAEGQLWEETAAKGVQVSEVVAVEAAPDQVAALLADLAGDRENVRAVAVLGRSGAGVDEVLPSPARFNRNADEAVRLIAGTWRFDAAPQSLGRVAANGAPATGRRYGGVDGGYGAEAAGDAGGGAGRYRRGVVADDAPVADAYGVAPELGSGGYRGTAGASADGARLDYAPPAQQTDPSMRPADEAVPATADRTEQFESLYKSNVSAGQAWVVSPLQVRTLPPEGTVQLQQEPHSEAVAPPPVREPDVGANVHYLPLAEVAAEPTLRPEAATGAAPSAPTAPAPTEFTRETLQEGRPNSSSPPARPDSSGEAGPLETPETSRSTNGPAVAQDSRRTQDSEKSEELARLEFKPTTKQVRMLVFFNVIPTGPGPAAEAAAQPAGAVGTGDQ